MLLVGSHFFLNSRDSIEDEPRSGRPITRVTQDIIETVRKVIMEEHHSTYNEIGKSKQPSLTELSIIHEHFKLSIVVIAYWAPHELTGRPRKVIGDDSRGFS